MTKIIGVIGTGAMGSGIAQVAAMHGCKVLLYDSNPEMLKKAISGIHASLQKLTEKQKISAELEVQARQNISTHELLADFKSCDMVIEAIVEDLQVKQLVFSQIEMVVNERCILASNTSSLSIASIASSCKHTGRVAGIHFFNPPLLMPLVEIIPALTTSPEVLQDCIHTIKSWNKTVVVAKDTPGFIVNRLARPYYGEAIKIYEEGIASLSTIDHAMKTLGGFKMGPFELMDFIGNDVNYKVTETVWQQMFYDPRYRPSLTQKRLFEARLFGRKTQRGYYSYAPDAIMEPPSENATLQHEIFNRIMAMLVNEAAEALYLGIASREDLDLAMVKGVNYRIGLLQWGDEIGLPVILKQLEALHAWYGDDRYRPSVMLKQLVKEKKGFYPH